MLHDARVSSGRDGVPIKPACVLTPAKDEGPYFVDRRLLRSDVRTDLSGGSPQEGVPLTLAITVVQAGGDCDPVTGAHVDIWQCNALGIYSAVAGSDTVGRDFLRGCQTTDGSGKVRFATIIPGWYEGRAVHVHLKVRFSNTETEGYVFTSQLFFEQALIDEILSTNDPYRARGLPDTRNDQDEIYGPDGWKLVVPCTREGAGYRGSIAIGLAELPR